MVLDNRWECIIGQEWLGDWLKEIGSLSTSIGSLGCLSVQNSTLENTSDTNNFDWIIYLATFLAVITLIFMILIGYMIYQQFQSNHIVFGGLRRVPSDMVNLIPENLSFPNPVVGSFSPILKPIKENSKNMEKIVLEPELNNEKKRVRFSENN